MEFTNYNIEFPKQKIPNSQKTKEWAAKCCDYVIAMAVGMRDTEKILNRYDILQGNIPDEFYKKILDPYNATKEKYKRFPATMRNYDLINGIVRRYIGEYLSNPHEFIVGANNPEIILNRDRKLAEEISTLIKNAIAAEIQKSYAQWVNGGNDPKQFDPKQQIDFEAFAASFKENYIDDISAQGQEILNLIRDITDDAKLYATAYFNWVTYGETYTYSDVVNNKLVKKVIPVIDAFPVHTNNDFVEDDDMFACREKLTYTQILDRFDDYLTDKDRQFLEDYYGRSTGQLATSIPFNVYQNYYGDVCNKFDAKERELFKNSDGLMRRDLNGDLFDVWHVVWKGFARKAIVTYVNEAGFVTQRVELDNYKLNKELGDIDIEYIYEPQVYECVRIGTRYDAVYPYGARAIAFNRNGKLPYNGMYELLPGMGQFSVVDLITPYQVFYNIVAYHREMAIARNKLSVLMIAKSLLGKDSEATIYRMIADGVLYIDDTDDQGMLRAQQVRMLNSDISQYINNLTQLLIEIETAAKNQVDFTAQRYGEIATSAGKGTTEEAIARGSMGSVLIEFLLDYMREKDYARDMDFTKLAWIDGLDTSYRDNNGDLKYISLNVDNHIYADYVIKAKSSVKELNKLRQLKEFAFSAAQNGDMKMAIAAITGDNVSTIKKLIDKFSEENRQHEINIEQQKQQLQQMMQEFEIQKITVKGEEDRKTEELKGYIDKEIELIKADANMISYNAEIGDATKEAGIDRLNAERAQLDREKLNIERQKSLLDAVNKERDRQVKLKDIDTKLKIAKENKNRYDVKKK